MKTTTKLASLLYGLLLLVGCTQESTLAPQPIPNTVEGEKQTLNITLNADADGLRTAQRLSPNLQTLLNESDLIVRLVVQYNGQSSHQTITMKKTPNENQAQFSGDIEVPAKGPGTYTLTAALIGQADGSEYATIESNNRLITKAATQLLLPKDGVLQSTIPYIAETTTTLNANGSGLTKCTLAFKPSATLLRLRIQNMTGRTETISKIKINSNAFVTEWSYDLSNYKSGNLVQGDASSTATEKTYDLPVAITLQDKESSADTYYLWVMPTKESTPSTRMYAVNPKGYEFLGFKRSNTPQLGVATTATLKPLPQMPITYFDDRPLYSDPTAITTPPFSLISGTQGTYYTAKETQDIGKLGDLTIAQADGSRTYYMPTAREVRSITHNNGSMLRYTQSTPLETSDNDVSFPWKPEVALIGSKSTYLAKDGVLYALRFQGYDNNRFLMAYRYEKVGPYTLGSESGLRITSRYLGSEGANTKLEDIATPTYWASNNEDDASGLLSALGWAESNRVPKEKGQTGHIHIANTADSYAYFFRFDAEGLWATSKSLTTGSTTRPIRLFFRK